MREKCAKPVHWPHGLGPIGILYTVCSFGKIWTHMQMRPAFEIILGHIMRSEIRADSPASGPSPLRENEFCYKSVTNRAQKCETYLPTEKLGGRVRERPADLSRWKIW